MPEAVAYFGAVDVDHRLRKNPMDPTLTPSQGEPIPPGEMLDWKKVRDAGWSFVSYSDGVWAMVPEDEALIHTRPRAT